MTTDRITQLEQRIANERKQLTKLKRAKTAKLEKQLGRAVLKQTQVTSLVDFQHHFSIIQKTDQPISKLPRETPPATDLKLQTQLQKIADQMTYTGRYWKIENLTEVSAWLAKFRSPESRA